MERIFLPESDLGLEKQFGRRWAVMQSFTLGGTADEILARAQQYCRVRCRRFGKPCPRPCEVDRRELMAEDGYYPSRLRELGWVVTLMGSVWYVSRS